MATKSSRRIVFDASVLRAAGTTDKPRSAACRQILEQTLKICHRAAVSRDLQAEWNRHQSGWSIKWLAAMQAKGKLIRLDPAGDTELEELIAIHTKRRVLGKDQHLVVLALLLDRVIVSLDKAVAESFVEMVRQMNKPIQLRWLNPEEDLGACVAYLRNPKGNK